MVRPIMKDRFFLSQKSLPATQTDLPTAQDLPAVQNLPETLTAHRDG